MDAGDGKTEETEGKWEKKTDGYLIRQQMM